ncbi:MAG: XisI protein [Ardenticatenaceae bacterium]|nr:XisI protein [Ardenticatenaceae bacterium]
MDKLNHYRQLIKTFLTSYATLLNEANVPGLETQTVFDENHDRYMVYRIGWWDTRRIHSVALYIRLYEGKIWIEEDGTEEGLATDLLAAGVPNEDIVLGFRHPELRPFTEFATA